jgi:exodeoxyribonuclease VII large subunit
MDLIDDFDEDGRKGGNSPEFSVTEISGAIKRVIEGEFSHVRIRGELGRVSRPRSGHIYLDLKDDRSVISAVIWKGVAARIDTQPEEGLEVVATGRITTYGGQSKYQLVIEDLAPAGMGALMAMLEKRKAALAAEGLFAPERKRPLPFLPRVIGVVTSPSGAVIRDILHRLRDRFPTHVLIWPVAVQGKACAPEVARAIAGFNRLGPGSPVPRPDLLIVARGGGSIEDLWGFNEEIVARAAAASDIPLISAVGHETDTTLIDYVSDRRAPTPTAAAELAVPVRSELLAWSADMQARLIRGQSQAVQSRRQRLADLARALPRPTMLTENARQRLDQWADRLPQSLIQGVQRRRVALSDRAGSLRPGLLRARLARENDQITGFSTRLLSGLGRGVAQGRRDHAALTSRLRPEALHRDTARKRADFDRLVARLSDAGQRDLQGRRDRLTALDRLRETLGYRETLARGYAVVRDGSDQVVTGREAAAKADHLVIEFADGRVDVGAGVAAGAARAEAPKPAAKTPAKHVKPAPKPKRPPTKDDPDQGSLF